MAPSTPTSNIPTQKRRRSPQTLAYSIPSQTTTPLRPEHRTSLHKIRRMPRRPSQTSTYNIPPQITSNPKIHPVVERLLRPQHWTSIQLSIWSKPPSSPISSNKQTISPNIQNPQPNKSPSAPNIKHAHSSKAPSDPNILLFQMKPSPESPTSNAAKRRGSHQSPISPNQQKTLVGVSWVCHPSEGGKLVGVLARSRNRDSSEPIEVHVTQLVRDHLESAWLNVVVIVLNAVDAMANGPCLTA